MKISRLPTTLINKLLALRAARGPYRFLVGDWERINDVDLATRVLGTEFFRSHMKPVPLPVTELRSIVLIAPHQDDESIGAGGTLLLAAKAGVKITIVYVTDGMQRERKPEEWRQVRRAEAQEVCDRLGAEMVELGICNLQPQPTIADVKNLSELLQRLRPQVLMVPWLLDYPVKHRIPSHLLWLAQKRFGLPECEVWGYQVHNTLYPNGYVDITAVAEGKRELIRCFRSQDYQPYDHLAMGMAAWNTRFLRLDPAERYAEVFFTLPLGEMLRLVEKFYFHDLQATYQGAREVYEGMSALQEQVVGTSSKSRRVAQAGTVRTAEAE